MENIDVVLENQTLKGEFTARALDLSQVFCPDPDDLERENRVLCNLLDWVQKYSECGDRKQMEAEGYDFPPIEPDFSLDNDWFLFERWMQGKPVRKTLLAQLPSSYAPKPPAVLTDEKILVELENLIKLLSEIHVTVDLVNDEPPRLVYEHTLETLDEEFELMTEGFWHLDGCSGYCPGCNQRPWCESGLDCCWPEDEEAGKMFLIDPVKKYVSASPESLKILREKQKERDKEFEEFEKKTKARI